eukprot:1702815-Rhodomonas_salina.3
MNCAPRFMNTNAGSVLLPAFLSWAASALLSRASWTVPRAFHGLRHMQDAFHELHCSFCSAPRGP